MSKTFVVAVVDGHSQFLFFWNRTLCDFNHFINMFSRPTKHIQLERNSWLFMFWVKPGFNHGDSRVITHIVSTSVFAKYFFHFFASFPVTDSQHKINCATHFCFHFISTFGWLAAPHLSNPSDCVKHNNSNDQPVESHIQIETNQKSNETMSWTTHIEETFSFSCPFHFHFQPKLPNSMNGYGFLIRIETETEIERQVAAMRDRKRGIQFRWNKTNTQMKTIKCEGKRMRERKGEEEKNIFVKNEKKKQKKIGAGIWARSRLRACLSFHFYCVLHYYHGNVCDIEWAIVVASG